MGDLAAVTATLATRCRSRARSRKHASAFRRFCARPTAGPQSRFRPRTLGERPSAAVGRGGRSIFLSVDPIVDQTGQPYSYAGDDPINQTDPLGLCWYCVVDPWSHANPLYENAQQGGLASQIVQTVDPAYMAINGYYNEAQAAENPCSSNWTIAWDAFQGVVGTVGTVGAAGSAGEVAGFVENPDATWQIGNRGFHLHYDDVPHGSMGSHLQLNTWQNGVKGSGWVKRWEWPPWQ